MIELNAFYDILLPELPGCDTPLVDSALIQVAREFCQTTSAWEVEFDPIELESGVTTYDLFPTDNDAQTVRLTSVTAGSTLLWKSTSPEVKRAGQTDAKYDVNKPPFRLTSDLLQIVLADHEKPAGPVVLSPTGDMLTVTGAVKPTLVATTLPDLLMSQFSEAMRFGVLGRLMLMNKKPWSDRDLASAYRTQWNAAVNFAAYQVATGYTRAPLRVRSYG